MRSLAVVVVLAGCSESEPSQPRGAAGEGTGTWAAAIELGSGYTGFEPLSDGDPLAIWTKGQGGFHVNVGGRVTAMSQEVAVHPELTLASTGEVLAGAGSVAYIALAAFDEADCSGEFWGVEALVEEADEALTLTGYVCSLEGQVVELWVEVENLGTRDAVSDSLELVVALDPSVEALCP